MAAALRTHVAEGELVEEPAKATPDEVWLAQAGERGWLCISKDRRLWTTPNQLAMIKKHRVAVIMVGDGTGEQLRELVVGALPTIRKVARRFGVSFVGRLLKGGRVRVQLCDGEKRDPPIEVKP